MLKRVAQTISDHRLLSRGASVVVGLSGGADSVSLLSVLLKLAPQNDWRICAAHFNHGIRGIEAESDEQYCEDLCKAMGVVFYKEVADVPKYAKEHGISIESAGRALRYEFLERVRQLSSCDVIAVAHHMDDNAESLLLHLLRGSGLSGLTGIQPQRGNIIRPLINVRRANIEAYLESEGISFCTDKTNLVANGTRNRLRLDIIPYMEAHINSAIIPTLCNTAELLLRDEIFLTKKAREALDSARRNGGFDRAILDSLDMPIKTRAIRAALTEAGAAVDIERIHIEKVCELLHAETGTKLTLPHIEAWVSYSLIKFGNIPKHESFETKLIIEGITETPSGDFKTTIINGTEDFYKSKNTAFLDYDKVSFPLLVRTRRDGDRFHPVNAPGRRKLKDYLIDRKVERNARDLIPLIADGSEVLYVGGFASSESAKITESTRKMLKIEYLG